ncbi:hypothetical protein B0H19DRAFT_1060152 [Mycena capillaripes]|nr:hypothetical protein B0H19DRAFT_1060152 [Mycena capillaripes]
MKNLFFPRMCGIHRWTWAEARGELYFTREWNNENSEWAGASVNVVEEKGAEARPDSQNGFTARDPRIGTDRRADTATMLLAAFTGTEFQRKRTRLYHASVDGRRLCEDAQHRSSNCEMNRKVRANIEFEDGMAGAPDSSGTFSWTQSVLGLWSCLGRANSTTRCANPSGARVFSSDDLDPDADFVLLLRACPLVILIQ